MQKVKWRCPVAKVQILNTKCSGSGGELLTESKAFKEDGMCQLNCKLEPYSNGWILSLMVWESSSEWSLIDMKLPWRLINFDCGLLYTSRQERICKLVETWLSASMKNCWTHVEICHEELLKNELRTISGLYCIKNDLWFTWELSLTTTGGQCSWSNLWRVCDFGKSSFFGTLKQPLVHRME